MRQPATYLCLSTGAHMALHLGGVQASLASQDVAIAAADLAGTLGLGAV